MRHANLLLEASQQKDPIDRVAVLAKYLISALRLTSGNKVRNGMRWYMEMRNEKENETWKN